MDFEEKMKISGGSEKVKAIYEKFNHLFIVMELVETDMKKLLNN